MADQKSRVQSEIENFLAEVTGARPQQNRKPQQSQRSQERAKRRQAEAQQRRRLEQEKQAEEQRRRAAEARKRKRLQQKKKRQVGSGIAQHVDQYITQHVAEHIDDDVDEYVEATIVDAVEDHLGARDVEMPSSGPRKKTHEAASAVLKLLQDPKGVRNAILVNEILSRPRALRR